jgi:hypothetical protein
MFDDDTCPVCNDACDTEHPCNSCGTSGRRNDGARRAEEEEIWQERYWRSQRDD